MIIDQTFGNAGHYWTFRVPGYFDRVFDTIDLTACYAHHKRVLQTLQWQAPRRALGAEMAVPPACAR